MRKLLNNAGDTIVEAMISITVIGLTIASAYGIANRSLAAARHAQERGEAVKVAEGQLEAVKAVTSGAVKAKAGFDIFDPGSVFCLNGTTAYTSFGSGWGSEIIPTDSDNLDGYDNGCVFPDSDGLYHTAVQTEDLGDGRYQYTVSVRWFRLGGGKDEVRMDYRIYKESN